MPKKYTQKKDTSKYEVYKISNKYGEVVAILDFSELPVANALQRSLKCGFVEAFGHLVPATVKQCYSAVRIFCRYLREQYKKEMDVIHENELISFTTWLQNRGVKNNTNQGVQNIIRSLISYMARQKYPGIPTAINVNLTAFLREEPKVTEPVDLALRKQIINACRLEIEEIDKRILHGRAEMEVASRGEPSELGEVLNLLARNTDGKVLPKGQLRKLVPGLVNRMNALGYREVLKYLYLTHRDIFPFYLAILIDTGGNPEAIHNASRDCLVEHPTRKDLILFVWEKKRAHSEQFLGQPANKEWSTPGLVKKLLSYTNCLIHAAPNSERNFLFLARTSVGIQRCCTQLLHLYLADFRKKHKLDAFNFKQFRVNEAENSYLQKGGIEAARSQLNHKSEATTRHYLRSEKVKLADEKVILKYAGQFEQLARRRNQSAELFPKESSANTVFGFECKDPFAGIAKGSQPGKVCMQFFGCSTCPGSIVVLDDPKIVARLVMTATSLRLEQKRAVAEGWSLRFERLWLPTLEIIQNDILPMVSDEMLNLASQQLVAPIPRLE